MSKNHSLLLIAALVITGMLISACGKTEVEVTKVVVEKETVIEKETITETVFVEGTPEVREVEITKEVIKEVEIVVTATPEPKGGDTLGFRLNEDPETLDNVLTISIVAEGQIAYILDRLFYFDAEGKVQPWLAESWEVSDDQKAVTVKVREGIKFHDGTDFNADAVKFHFDRILDPEIASPVLPYVGSLQEVNVLDEFTVEFNFEEPYAAFFLNMSYAYGGINSPAAVEEWGDEYGLHPVGTGPFMLQEWIPGSQMTLIRNPDYQNFREDVVNSGPPLAEKLVFTVIPEDGVAQAAMETGEIIAASLSSDMIARFVTDPNFNVQVDQDVANMHFIEFNYAKPPFDDPAFRKALGYAVDREAIVLAARDGYGHIALSPLAKGIPGFDPEVAEAYGTPYDPDKALELLAELGWEDHDGDGILDKDGQPAKFLLKSYTPYVHIARTMEVIQDSFKEIGIEVELELSDWGAFYPSLLEDNWDMDLMRWTWGDAVVLTDLFRSPGHREHLLPDPELDEVLDRCDTTMDPDLRNECVSEAQRLLLEKAIAIPLYSNWDVFATQNYVRDYTIDYNGFLMAGDIWLDK